MRHKTPPSFEYYETHTNEHDIDSAWKRSIRRERYAKWSKRALVGLGGIATAVVMVGHSVVGAREHDAPRWEPHVAADFAQPGPNNTPTCSGETSLRANRLLGILSQQIITLASSENARELDFTAAGQPKGYYGRLDYVIKAPNGHYEFGLSVASDGKGGYIADSAFAASITATQYSPQSQADTGDSVKVSVGSPTTSKDSGGPNLPPDDVTVAVTKDGLPSIESWFEADPATCDTTLQAAEQTSAKLLKSIKNGTPIESTGS